MPGHPKPAEVGRDIEHMSSLLSYLANDLVSPGRWHCPLADALDGTDTMVLFGVLVLLLLCLFLALGVTPQWHENLKEVCRLAKSNR